MITSIESKEVYHKCKEIEEYMPVFFLSQVFFFFDTSSLEEKNTEIKLKTVFFCLLFYFFVFFSFFLIFSSKDKIEHKHTLTHKHICGYNELIVK